MSSKIFISKLTLRLSKLILALFVILSVFVSNQSNIAYAEIEEFSLNQKTKFQVSAVKTNIDNINNIINDTKIVDKEGALFTVVETVDSFATAKNRMNALNTASKPHVVTVVIPDERTGLLYTKIIAQPAGGFAQSYPYRSGTVGSTAKGNTLKIYSNTALTSDNGYIPGHIQMRVYDVIQQEKSFVADVEVAGQRGYVDINKIDLIPKAFMRDVNGNGGLDLFLGGHENYYSKAENNYTMRVKPEYFSVNKNGSYNEITFYQYRTFPGMYDAVSTFGIAPDWMDVGTYFSDNHITYYRDVERKNQVLNGTSQGEYYSYFQWLPVNSISLHGGDVLRNHLTDTKYTDSVYYNETQAFVENGNKYGMNSLLIFAQANLESAYGTSKYAKDRNNLFGWNAVDSNPDNAARFGSVSDSINLHMSQNLMEYMIPKHWKHYGFSFGNMSSGVSYKYASDPLYGMKIASIAYTIDKKNGFKDYNNYQLTKIPNNTVKNFTTGAGSGGVVYSNKSLKNQIVANLGVAGNYIKTNRTISDKPNSILDLTKDFVYFPNSGVTNIAKFGPGGTSLPSSSTMILETSRSYTFTSDQKMYLEWNDKSTVVATIPKGSVLKGYATNNGYVHFQYKEFKGYVKEGSVVAGSIVKPTEKTGTYKVIGSQSLNIRNQPNVSISNVVGSIPKNTIIEVVDNGNVIWGTTTYNGVTGYVHFDYLERIGEKPTPPEPEPEPKPPVDVFKKGDVNGDGAINALDINAIKRHILNLAKLSSEQFERANVSDISFSGVDELNAADINAIKRHFLNLEQIK